MFAPALVVIRFMPAPFARILDRNTCLELGVVWCPNLLDERADLKRVSSTRL